MSQTALTAENQDSLTACAHSAATMVDELSFQRNKSNTPVIGIDLLGGDHNHPEYILETLQGLAREVKDSFCLVVFTTPEMHDQIKSYDGFDEETLFCYPVNEVIHMDDDPLLAIRRKKNSSMSIGMRLLNEKKIDAFVSTGNTGALIANAKMHLPTLPGINRAALLTMLPTKTSPVAVIDVGANVECSPENLVQFGLMAYAFQKSRGISHPRIGLLNIGTEETKGRVEFRETYQLLQKLNRGLSEDDHIFIGNVEGKQIFSGKVDVLITDGFTGNVFLKTAEGISSFILETLQEYQSIFSFSPTLFSKIKHELYSTEHPGAILCGVDGLVVKCHGDINPKALTSGIKGALNLVQSQFLDKLKAQLQV